MHNLFIESGNDLYDDINEMSVPMTKYNGLLKLLESEQERNKNLEEKYLAFINEITQNITLNKKKIIEPIKEENIEQIADNLTKDIFDYFNQEYIFGLVTKSQISTEFNFEPD